MFVVCWLTCGRNYLILYLPPVHRFDAVVLEIKRSKFRETSPGPNANSQNPATAISIRIATYLLG